MSDDRVLPEKSEHGGEDVYDDVGHFIPEKSETYERDLHKR